MPRNFLNEQPFEHRCRHGTVFKADRCDFANGVDAHLLAELTESQLAADAFELGWWHNANIVPDLNGFNGPPRIRIHRA